LSIDNFTHVMNLQKRIEFLNEWITKIYPNFDFVEYLKGILLDNPISINDGAMFYDFMKKYISETKANESDETKEKRNNIKNKLFKIFVENNQRRYSRETYDLYGVTQMQQPTWTQIFSGLSDFTDCFFVEFAE